ncbi:hypothetical protein KSF73_16735 [Burkholderiaceae bacterium DAT-1]|nr:hypothetical protein [Burkholderiaceae bacterium DAT-1]
MILFLDFDGVLHPECSESVQAGIQEFCHLPRFEGVMRDYPHVDIVISSMWRELQPLDALKAYFSPDFAHRLIDVTPTVPREAGKYLPAQREQEILAWLNANGRIHAPWIALDDAEWQFRDHRDHLVACQSSIGLDATVEVALRAALNRFTQGPAR